MYQDVINKLLKKYHNPVVGLKLSKHFFERLCERFGGDIGCMRSVISHCDKNLCELIYECCTSHNSKWEVELSDIKFVVVCTIHEDYPVLTVTTCYTKASSKNKRKKEQRW